MTLVIGVVIALLLVGWRWWSEKTSFDGDRWRANGGCRNDVRSWMVGDLKQDHLRINMTRDDVEQLLGRADYRSDQDHLSYLIAPTLTDCKILEIQFRRGRLVGVREWEN